MNTLKNYALLLFTGVIISSLAYAGVTRIEAPSEPLNARISEIFKDGCTVEYLPPKSDGGAPIENI